jgi:predicted phage terminase large subunit-like protein
MTANDPKPELEEGLRPQEGPQTAFLSSSADVAIYGGAAGGGKSYALLLEPLYDVSNPGFRCVLFRKSVPQLKQAGGIWDTSASIYPRLGAVPRESFFDWTFPSGAVVKMAGLELESDKHGWDGSQIPLICFDELQHFDASVFWYLFARCRSTCGVKSRIRATCNPDCNSFLRKLLDWWIDPVTGLAIKERAGVLRFFVRLDDTIYFSNTSAELVATFGSDAEPKSLAFYPASVYDNKLLLKADPSYVSNLKALSKVERERLLNGNWNVKATAGSYFKREYFGMVDAAPAEVVGRVRYWDRAASELRGNNDPDATVGLLLSKDAKGTYFVEDVRKMFATPFAVEQAMVTCAQQDPVGTVIGAMTDPGSAGKYEQQAAAAALDGYNVRFSPATGDKETRAKPMSAQAEAGNVKLVRGPWNDEFLRVLESFPLGGHDDEADALSGAHALILESGSGAFGNHSRVHIPTPLPGCGTRVFTPRHYTPWRFQ